MYTTVLPGGCWLASPTPHRPPQAAPSSRKHKRPPSSTSTSTRLLLPPHTPARAAAATSVAGMTVKPTATSAPHLALDVIKSGAAGMEPKKKPAPARARAWTWTRIVRYVSLYYLVNVIGNGITIEGFRRLVAAGDTDLAARGRATGVIAAGNLLRMVAASAETILCEARRWEQAVMVEFFLETLAVTLYVHFTMDAFGCSCPCPCPCPHQC